MKYQTKDGKTFEARSEIHLVQQLHTDSQEGGDLLDWMSTCAHRASLQTGCPVDGSTPTTLVRDLVIAGLLKEIHA